MAATQLIDLLEIQGLLDPEVISELRRQVSQSKTRMSSESIAKLLVENDQLTRFQATRLISQLKEDAPEADSEPRLFSNPVSGSTKSTKRSGGDEMDLLPSDMVEEVQKRDPNRAVDATVFVDAAEAEIIEDVTAEEVIEVTSAPKRKKRFAESGEMSSTSRSSNSAAATFTQPKKIVAAKPLQWDAFRIWGYGFILMTLVTAFAGLVYWFTSQGADGAYKVAEDAYSSLDYEVAIEKFESFSTSHASDQRAGRAKVFAAIAKIRHANDQMGDPVHAIEISDEVLPKIVNEPSVNDLAVRADLAQSLVAIAEKLVQRADNAKTTDERKALIEKLDKHFVTLQNPQYVPNAQRETNEVRIKSVREDRERLLRDVKRSEGTVAAIDGMNAAIAKGDVDAAYQARRKVVRDFPQTALDKQLLELLKQATSPQQKAVQSTTLVPQPAEPIEKSNLARSVLLVKQSGSPINVGQEAIYFVKAKQSIYGLKAVDGSVLWRRHVGAETISDPIRLSSDAAADCLMVSPEKGRVARLNAVDGTSVWELQFENRLSAPSVDGENIFVSTEAGQVYSIDALTGQIRWAKQLPQRIETSVGGGANKPGRYCLGQHSNLYVLSRNDGACKEVYYTGHASGTVAVPPVYTLGQLLIFENAGPGYCNMHILKTGDQGDQLTIAQKTIQLKGHVVVPPSLDGRRMVVVTDLGEVNAYDIEPASSGDKVNRVAGIVANENKPRIAWPCVAGNDLWIAGNRLTRFQIQVSKQQLVRDWVREEEDQFTGRPFKIEDYVIHSRVLRGTQGVRVSAINGISGDPVWEVDLGVPVVAIQGGNAGVTVINSQAALFNVTAKSLVSGKPLVASENPGRNQRKINFVSPVVLGNGKIALLNFGQGTQVVLLDPKAAAGSNLLMNMLQLTSGVPSADPIAVGQGVVVPLDNSQLAFIDPNNGKQIGAPFQPTLEPGIETRWLSPALLSDKQTVIAATTQKKIHRLSTGKQLRSLTEASTPAPLTGRLAAVQDTVCAIARGESQDSLELYSGTDLSRIAGIEQDGRISWGPYGVESQFVAGSETSGFVSIDATGKLLWKTDLPMLSFVGQPLVEGSDILVSTTSGKIFRIELATGIQKGVVDLGEPISGPASILGPQLLLPGAEGVLLAVPVEKTRQGNADGNADQASHAEHAESGVPRIAVSEGSR